MKTLKDREFLKAQLLQVQQLRDKAVGHPLMQKSMQHRYEDLERQLAAFPVDLKTPAVSLFFTGKPVYGSIGIDAAFIGTAMVPFQHMIHAEYAQRVHEKVGQRGQIKGWPASRLFVTSLLHGSFGVELSHLSDDDTIDEAVIADSLSTVTNLIRASAESDEAFAAYLGNTTPRIIPGLRNFLRTISDEDAGVIIESGTNRCELLAEKAHSAFSRVDEVSQTEQEVTLKGVLTGVLPLSLDFNFTDVDGKPYAGKIGEMLDTDEVVNHFNKPCTVQIRQTKVNFQNGRERISYILLGIRD